MGQNDGASKTPLEVTSFVAEMKDKKLTDEFRMRANFHATIERLLNGKEIIKVAHRDPLLDKPSANQFVDFKVQKFLSDQQMEDGEVPGWLLKVYENLHHQEDYPKMHTSWLLQHLADDRIPDEAQDEKDVKTPASYKNNDINDSDSGKISTNEIVQLIDRSLNFKKFYSESKLLQPLRVQILQEKLDETLIKLKSVLTEKPKDWEKIYTIHVATVKAILKKLEGFLKEVETGVLKEPVYDLKTRAMAAFALNAKENLENFKQSLKQWDNLAKTILESDQFFSKTDDIILVERKKRAVTETRKVNDGV